MLLMDEREARTPRILLAEDDDDLRALVAQTLRHAGYAVATTGDGSSALEMIGSYRPDLAVLDVVMPGLSGFEICRRLQERSTGPRPPVILLSGRTAPAAIRAGLEAGAAVCHLKPVDLTALLHDVRGVL